MDKTLCRPCEFDDLEKRAIAFCINCSEFLCTSCCRSHRKNTVTRAHQILTGDLMPKDDRVYQEINRITKCGSHPDKDIEFECGVHGALICVSCLTHSHRHCENVNDLSLENTHEAFASITDKLQALQAKTREIRFNNEKKTAFLQNQKQALTIGLTNFTSQLKQQVDTLNSRLINDSDKEIESHIKATEIDKKTCSNISKDILNTVEIQEATEYLDNNVFKYVVGNHCADMKDRLRLSIEEMEAHTTTQYTFEGHSSLKNISKLGIIVSKTIDFSTRLENVKTYGGDKVCIEKTSDSACQPLVEKTNKYDKQTSKRELESNKNPCYETKSLLLARVTRYGKSVKSKDDENTCSISACALLPDSKLLVLDSRNYSVKLLDKHLTVLHQTKLVDIPTDMCVSNVEYAVCYVCCGRSKSVYEFKVSANSLCQRSHYQTDFHPISITSLESNMLFLMCTEFPDKTGCTKKFIELRRGDNMLKLTLPSELCLKWCKRIRICGKNRLMVVEDTNICSYRINISMAQITNILWFYKDRTPNCIQAASDIAFDSEGNMYMCATDSNNIHQISAMDFWDSRVIGYNTKPLSLEVDSKKRCLYVGCAKNDYLYVYNFN